MRKPTVKELLSQYGIDYLYHMTSVDNLSSILLLGLVCHHQARDRNLIKTDISDQNVQKLRRDKIVKGIPLHQYVPLYFNPRNPMLFVQKNIQNNIAILAVDPLLLSHPQTVFTDGNAACGKTNFYWDLSSLSKLNWDIIRQSTWYDKPDGKRIKCAEVLVYSQIPVRRIIQIFCYSEQMVAQIKALKFNHLSIVVEVNKSLYF